MHDRHHGLDILRAAAIGLVLLCHGATTYPGGLPAGWGVLGVGGRGVDLFFVLSGYLLGRLLCREVQQTGRIGLQRFWMRRWLRTLPAYYAVLALTLIQARFFTGREIDWSYFVFGQTYFSDLPYFGVSWSLCVEEHFYLLIAPLLACCAGRRWAPVMFAVLLLGPEVCRLAGWYTSSGQTHLRINQCAVGVVLAYAAVYHPALWTRLVRAMPLLLLVAVGFLAYSVAARFGVGWGEVQSTLAWGLAFGVLVAAAAARQTWRFRIPGVTYLASRSYAAYLLHPEAIAVAKRLPLDFPLHLLVVGVVTLLASEVLYRVIEKPFMDLREHLPMTRSGRIATPTAPAALAPA